MRKHSNGQIGWRVLVICFVVLLIWSCASMSELKYSPSSKRNPVVIIISGVDGINESYRNYASEVRRLGYYAVLLDGNNYNPHPAAGLGGAGACNLRQAILTAQRSPEALPGKVAVIGFSLGGGGALSHAATMPDLVSAIIAYYPMTMHVSDMRIFTAQFKVPILVLAGEKDIYHNCCLIGSMRAMEAQAKAIGAPFELVVYPNAGHAFNLEIYKRSYRAEDAADAWQRTTKMLGQHQPLR